MERLQKVLAWAGVASRRECEALIIAGRVSVNGHVVQELGTRVEPGHDVLAVDGHTIGAQPALVYIMLNKLTGYVSTTDDPQGRPTVLDAVKPLVTGRLYPVGRLDADSEGLLLLTNDGALTERLTHPRYELQKEYLAWVTGRPSALALARLRAGIPLDGALAAVDSVRAEPHSAESSDSVLRIVIHEGRKREIRRLCAAIGHPVRRLQRVRLGPLHLGDLAPGASRSLTAHEIAALLALLPSVSLRSSAPSLLSHGEKRRSQTVQNTPTRRRHAEHA